jgi:hypothetical protein
MDGRVSCQMLYVPGVTRPGTDALTRAYLMLWSVTGLCVSVALNETKTQVEVKSLTRTLLAKEAAWVKKTPGYLSDLGRGMPMLKSADADKGRISVVAEPELEPTQPEASSSSSPTDGGTPSGSTQQKTRAREKAAKDQAEKEDGNSKKRGRSADDQRAQDTKEAKAGAKAKETVTPKKRRAGGGLSKPEETKEKRGGVDDDEPE